MEVKEAIEKRRTIRVFKNKISETELKNLLLAGSKAPSGSNGQTWEFIHVQDQALIDRIAELKYQMNRKFTPAPGQTLDEVDMAARFQQKAFANANVVVVCSGRGKVADGWLAVENILLSAVAEGLGAGIIALRDEPKAETEKLLEIPPDKELVCVLKIGVPNEEPKPKKFREPFSWLHHNRYGE